MSLHQHHCGSRRPVKCNVRDRQAENGPGMQRKLGQILRNQRDHASVMGSR